MEDQLREGEVYRVGPLEPSPAILSGDSALHSALLRLRTTRKTRWQRLSALQPPLRALPLPRQVASLADLPVLGRSAAGRGGGGLHAARAVFDFTGMVLGAGPQYQAPDYLWYQWIFLGDASCGQALTGASVRGGGVSGTVDALDGNPPAAAEAAAAVAAAAAEGLQAAAPEGVEAAQDGATGGQEERQSEGQACDAAAPWLLAVRLSGEREAVNWVDATSVASPAGAAGPVVVCLKDLELSAAADEQHRLWRAEGGQHSAVARMAAGPAWAAVAAWAGGNAQLVAALRQRVGGIMG